MINVYIRKIFFYLEWAKLIIEILVLFFINMVKISFQVFKFLGRLFYNTYIASDKSKAARSSTNREGTRGEKTKLYDILKVPISADNTDIKKVNV